MNTFKTQDKTTVKRVSRWIRIQYSYNVTRRHSLFDYVDTYDGDNTLAWFRHNSRKYAIGQFEMLAYPIFFDDEYGKLAYLSGYDATQWYKPYLIEIHPDGECIRLYEEVNREAE